jgi:glucokinase
MPIKKPVIGVDLGGTNMQIGVVTADGKIIGRAKKKTRAAEGARSVLDRLVAGIDEACHHAGIDRKKIAAVGIGAPGAIDPKTGVVLQAPNLRWSNYPLAKNLREAVGVPVAVTNDVRAAVLGEHAFGAGKGASHLLAMWIGTGVGGGLILNGEIYTGFMNTAGEIGHMPMLPGGPMAGRSLENLCSRTAIADRIVKLIKTGRTSLVTELADGDWADVKAKVIGIAYHKGDPLVKEVMEDAARLIGGAAAALNSALSLQRIVLGGGLTEAMGESLVRLVRHFHDAQVYPHVLKKTEIVKTKLEADAGVVGASILAHKMLDGKLEAPVVKKPTRRKIQPRARKAAVEAPRKPVQG